MTNIKSCQLHWQSHLKLDRSLNEHILCTNKFYTQVIQCKYSIVLLTKVEIESTRNVKCMLLIPVIRAFFIWGYLINNQ